MNYDQALEIMKTGGVVQSGDLYFKIRDGELLGLYSVGLAVWLAWDEKSINRHIEFKGPVLKEGEKMSNEMIEVMKRRMSASVAQSCGVMPIVALKSSVEVLGRTVNNVTFKREDKSYIMRIDFTDNSSLKFHSMSPIIIGDEQKSY